MVELCVVEQVSNVDGERQGIQWWGGMYSLAQRTFRPHQHGGCHGRRNGGLCCGRLCGRLERLWHLSAIDVDTNTYVHHHPTQSWNRYRLCCCKWCHTNTVLRARHGLRWALDELGCLPSSIRATTTSIPRVHRAIRSGKFMSGNAQSNANARMPKCDGKLV